MMNHEIISTATPEAVWEKKRYVKKPQVYSARRIDTTNPLIIIFRNPFTVSCSADRACNVTIDYKEAEQQLEDIAAVYSNSLGTSTTLPLKGIDLLEDKYALDHKAEVVSFMNEHPALEDVLMETHGQIRRIFGDYLTVVVLSPNKDLEEDYTGLSITIKTTLKTAETLSFLDRFDEEWWLDLDAEIRNAVTVMVRSA